jgi:TP901 family phage tail tape measure protein
LNQLAAGFVKYTNALAESAGGTANFNSAQKQFVDLLAKIEIQAKLTAGAIKDLNGGVANTGKQLQSAAALTAQNNAAAAANQLKGQFDTSNATPQQLTQFTAALQTFQTRAAKAGLDTKTLNQIVGQTGQTFTGAAAGVNQAALKVAQLGQGFGQIPQQVNQASNSVNNFSFSIGRLLEVFTFQQLLRGVGALTGALAQAIPEAIAFEKQVAAIATISDSSDKNLTILSQRVISLANEFGKPAAEVAAGFYQTLSNQVGNSDQSIQFFTEALKLSRATLGDVGDAVNALSGIQLSYGQSSAQAAHNADILFSVVDLGRVTLKELGDSLGRLNPLAAQLGVSTEEIGAALSVATQKGVNFRDAQTQILNLLTAALKPSADFKKRLDELGFASAEAGIAAKGFIGFFTAISAGATSSAELAKLFQNIRGLRGELSLFGDDGKAVAAALADIESRAGAAQKAFETIQFTNAVNVESELNRIKNILIAGFGHDAVAALAALNTAFGGVANTVSIVAGTLAGLAALGVGVTIFNQLAIAVTAAATALAGAAGISFAAAVGTVIAATGGIALAIGLAVAGFIALRQAIADSDIVAVTATQFEEVRKEIAKNATIQSEAVRASQVDQAKAIEANASAVISAEAQKQQVFIQSSNLAKALQAAETDSFNVQLNSRLRAFNSFQSDIKKLQDDNAQNVLRLQQNQRKTELDLQQSQFQRFNSQFSEQRQASNLQTQFARLQNKANTAFNSGDIKTGNEILGLLEGIAKQYGDITGKTQLERQFLLLNANATQKQIDLGNQQVAAAAKLEAANQPIIDDARRKIELAQQLEKELDKAPPGSEQAKILQGQIVDIANQIDKLGGKLTLGNLKVGNLKGSDVQNAVDALRKAVGGVPLAFSAQKGFEKVAADTKAFFDAHPLTVALGFEFNEKGFADAQKKAQEALKQAQAGLNSEQALPGLTDAAKAATDNLGKTVQNLFTLLQSTAIESVSTSEKLALLIDPTKVPQIVATLSSIKQEVRNFEDGVKQILDTPLNFDETGTLSTSAIKAIGVLKNNLITSFKDADLSAASEGATAGIVAGINAQISATETLVKDTQALKAAQQAAGAGANSQNILQQKADVLAPTQTDIQTEEQFDRAIKDAADSARNLQTSIQATSNAIVTDISISSQSVNGLNKNLQSVGSVGFNAGEEVAIGIDSIGIAAASQIPAVFSLIFALEELAAAEASAGGGGGGGGEFASRGGMMFFANGGLAPRGKDTIPAFLSPGEIVMNPNSSRRFFSQLMAMNSGVQPTFNSNGGSVSNTFGDIHVNVSGGASGIDGRTIANAIRRELRRGTTKL